MHSRPSQIAWSSLGKLIASIHLRISGQRLEYTVKLSKGLSPKGSNRDHHPCVKIVCREIVICKTISVRSSGHRWTPLRGLSYMIRKWLHCHAVRLAFNLSLLQSSVEPVMIVCRARSDHLPSSLWSFAKLALIIDRPNVIECGSRWTEWPPFSLLLFNSTLSFSTREMNCIL